MLYRIKYSTCRRVLQIVSKRPESFRIVPVVTYELIVWAAQNAPDLAGLVVMVNREPLRLPRRPASRDCAATPLSLKQTLVIAGTQAVHLLNHRVVTTGLLGLLERPVVRGAAGTWVLHLADRLHALGDAILTRLHISSPK